MANGDGPLPGDPGVTEGDKQDPSKNAENEGTLSGGTPEVNPEGRGVGDASESPAEAAREAAEEESKEEEE
jgi:hypothetical protein